MQNATGFGVDETLAEFRRIREEQDREYAEALAKDEAKVQNAMCIQFII